MSSDYDMKIQYHYDLGLTGSVYYHVYATIQKLNLMIKQMFY